MHNSTKNRALDVARKGGVLRARDFYAAGIPHTYLSRLRDDGLLLQIGRGIYQHVDLEPTESHSLAVVSKSVPHGVICLISALRFHDLTTQLPRQVWILIEQSKWTPVKPPVSFRVIRTKRSSLMMGVEWHTVEGVSVPITNPSKTVADCFKHRNKVGIDVAVESLRECIQQRRATANEIWQFAKLNRVANVIRPYIESIQL